jgi:signal transduction histidine kinase
LGLAIASFVVSLVLLVGTLAVSIQQRTRQYSRLTTALDTERWLADTAVCVEDLHRQLSLLGQTIPIGDSDAGLEPTTRAHIMTTIETCRGSAGRLESTAILESETDLVADVDVLLKFWTRAASGLGTTEHAASLQTLAVEADPIALDLIGARLPLARSAYTGVIDDARADFDRMARATDILLVLVAFLALGATGLVTATVLSLERGVTALMVGARAYRAGRLEHRIDAPGSEEFDGIADQMNGMAASLVGARSELESRAERLESSLQTLREAQERLVNQQKMAALGNLVAGVAHEVNTPLGVAITATSFLDDSLRSLEQLIDAPELSRPEMRDVLSDGLEASGLLNANLARAAELIRSFKQVAVDRSHLETRQLMLDQWLESVVKSLTPLLRKHAASITVDAPVDVELHLSAGKLEQVLTNLCVNSMLHGYPPAVERLGEGAPAGITINASIGQDCLMMKIADKGAGMSKEVVDRVFDPFFTTARGSGGTGLGMHIVHQVVTAVFDGTVDLETKLGQGTCWQLSLPLGTPALRRVKVQA